MQRSEAGQWQADVAAAIDAGYSTPVALMALDVDGLEVRLRLRNDAGDGLTLAVAVPDGGLPTVTELLPELAWDEREAAEMFGVAFPGHETPRLLLTAAAPAAPMRKEHLLDARHAVVWPGIKEPGEDGSRPVTRRRTLPVGVDPERMAR